MRNTHSEHKEYENDSEPSPCIQSHTRDVVELGLPVEIPPPNNILKNEPHKEGRRRVDPRCRGIVEQIREPNWGKDLGC